MTTPNKSEETKKTIELWTLYAKKLAELEVKKQLEQHYTPIFEKCTKLLEEYVTLSKKNTELFNRYITQLEKITEKVRELHDYVFKGAKKAETYTT